nr:MAG TPA: hypothetical protein [Bacteriophage sp.]
MIGGLRKIIRVLPACYSLAVGLRLGTGEHETT